MNNTLLRNAPTVRESQGLVEILLATAVTVVFPPILLLGFFVVNPREELVVLRFGKYVRTITEPGIRWSHPVGRELRRISTRDATLDIATTTVVEKNGNPVEISAVVVYRIADTFRAAINVESPHRFIEDQAGAVIKRVASQFPYESVHDDVACLKKESDEVTQVFINELQEAVDASGIEVLGVRLNDLTYAPEIAQAMLMRQQALALIDARKTLVEGAVEIANDALLRLDGAEVEMSRESKEQLISSLLVVICSGDRPQPVLQVQSAGR